jgi:lipid II:glycine glycyltransferase (peptidoglycan interpeptide bridge formation enzyme)
LFIKSFLDKINNIEIHDHVDFNSSKLVSSNYISVLDLTRYNSTEDIYKTLDYSSVKYMVNRAKKNIVINSDYTKENFDAFYMMETDVRLRQGSPMYPQDFFSNMCEIFNNTGMIDIKIAMLNDKPVAGAIFFNFAHTKTYAYSASINDKEIKKYGANEYLLWSAIADASGAGFKCFDFGTTPDHLIGLLKYKEKWNATSTKLDYSFIGYDKIKTVNRNSPSVKLISFIISKTPKVIFRKLSPYLLKAAV